VRRTHARSFRQRLKVIPRSEGGTEVDCFIIRRLSVAGVLPSPKGATWKQRPALTAGETLEMRVIRTRTASSGRAVLGLPAKQCSRYRRPSEGAWFLSATVLRNAAAEGIQHQIPVSQYSVIRVSPKRIGIVMAPASARKACHQRAVEVGSRIRDVAEGL